MLLYRVFPMVQGRGLLEPGGPLFVPRSKQGAGRHDQPDHYGALYLSRSATSAVAERIQIFRGQVLAEADLKLASGARHALAIFDDSRLDGVADLDDPAELVRRELRPSRIATHRRAAARQIAYSVFADGAPGFAWWSTLEASWINVTLFAERVIGLLSIVGEPQPLTSKNDVLIEAAEAIGLRLSTSGAWLPGACHARHPAS